VCLGDRRENKMKAQKKKRKRKKYLRGGKTGKLAEE